MNIIYIYNSYKVKGDYTIVKISDSCDSNFLRGKVAISHRLNSCTNEDKNYRIIINPNVNKGIAVQSTYIEELSYSIKKPFNWDNYKYHQFIQTNQMEDKFIEEDITYKQYV